ncbi:short-chain dehydrogenase/reductase family 42E member 1-like [Lineus longissimus]
MAIMAANGSQVEGGGKLATCALRLAGVYGPAEQRHLPRIVSYLERGLMAFSYGSDPITDYLHIDNLVQVEILAGEALSEKKDRVAAGQTYFISDNKPINTFEFFRPLVQGLGFSGPYINLPLKLIYFIAIITEFLHSIIGRVYNFQPLLTKTEVYKTGVTHYFSIEKAARDLGYCPTVQNRLDEVIQHFKSLGHGKKETKEQSFIMRYLVNIIIAFIFASIILSFLPVTN